MNLHRRPLILGSLSLTGLAATTGLAGAAAHQPAPTAQPAGPDPDEAVASALRQGGVVFAMRHALAPGTFDPPEFRLGDCSTQRNLSAEGRAQAGRTGQWFSRRALRPALVRSSPWCRCVDTATLAFGTVQPWAALGSPRGSGDADNRRHLQQLRQALAAVPAGRFEVWVTHMFVLADLVGAGASSGEGLVLRSAGAGPGAGTGAIEVIARLAPA